MHANKNFKIQYSHFFKIKITYHNYCLKEPSFIEKTISLGFFLRLRFIEHDENQIDKTKLIVKKTSIFLLLNINMKEK